MSTNVGSISYDLDINTAKFNTAMAGIKTKMATVSGSANSSMGRMEQSADGLGGSFAKLGTVAKVGLATVAVAAVAAGAAITAVFVKAIPDAIARVDTLKNAPKVLQNLGFSAEDSAAAIKKIDLGLRGLPTSLDAGVDAFMRFTTTTNKGIGYATDLTLAFNNMALAGGRGPEEASRALVQFTQVLGRGKVSMQEWNTMNEVMPAQMKQVATSMLGATATTMDLYDALQGGTISLEQFTDEIVKLDSTGGASFASFKAQAKDATGGIATGITNMKTAITRGVAKIIEAIGSDNIKKALDNMGKNFDKIFTSVAQGIDWIKKKWGEWSPTIIRVLSVVGGWITWLKDKFEEAKPIIAEAFKAVMPFLELFKDAISKIIDEIEEFWDKNQGWLIPVLQLIGAIIIGVVVVAFALLTVAIGVVVGAVYYSLAAWNWLVDRFNQVKEAIGTVISKIQQFADKVAEKFEEIRNNVTQKMDNTRNSIIYTWEYIKSYIASVLNSIRGIVSGVFNAIWGVIVGIMSGIWGYIAGAWNSMYGIIARALNAIYNHVANTWNNVRGAIIGVVNGIIGFFGGAGGWLLGAGRQIIQGLINGIGSMAGAVYGKAREIANTVKDTIASALRIKSPSRVMFEMGTNVGEGFVKGIDSTISAIQAISKDMSTEVTKPISASQTGTTATSSVNNIYGNISLGDQNAVDRFFDRLNRNGELAQKGLTTI
jgi:tape measure domain-containing protein